MANWLTITRCFGPLCVWLAMAGSTSFLRAQESNEEWRAKVDAFFRLHCSECHSATKAESDLNMEKAPWSDFRSPTAKEWWSDIVNVLNSHEMPPEEKRQPDPNDVAKVVELIRDRLAQAELAQRESSNVLRRMNRDEYRNTIRDLVGIELDVSSFPVDPSAGGFDNNGRALTLSPMLIELYYATANKILDEAFHEQERPASIRWRFEIDSGSDDSNRVRMGENNAIVNGGNNPVEDGWKVVHHDNWDKVLNVRDFVLPEVGQYTVRIRAAGEIPARKQVVESAEAILRHRMEEQNQKNPQGSRWHQEQFANDLRHFQTDRMYDYGPPRLKLIRDLGGQPVVLQEFDIDATRTEPKVFEFSTKMTKERVGISLQYAYDVPSVLENFWLQGSDRFARPVAYVDWIEIEGPIYDSWPPRSRQLLIGDRDLNRLDRADRETQRREARQILSLFMRKAYRRPVKSEEIDNKLALFDEQDHQSFLQRLKPCMAAVLCSPHFLYLTEPFPEDGNERRLLNSHELASRLSYFLWSTMPDEELMRLASKDQLKDPEVLVKQVSRMLKDPKSSSLAENFCAQWLGLREVGANPPAKDLYPHYDRHLETSMVRESKEFFLHILNSDSSALDFVRSDYVVINERLARFYGITNVRGDHFRKVSVMPEHHRGGVVTQAAIHTITSNGTRTSPVKRGTWILKNLLGTDPGLPVANAGDIAPKVPGIDKATVRQRLEIHRTLPQCARCHNKIDPLGFALENYNASGEWRDQEGFGYKGRIEANDPHVDASSKLPDGTLIEGVEGLQKALLSKEDLFLNCLAGKLYGFALGRELGVSDQRFVRSAAEHLAKNGYRMSELIEYIVLSPPFQSK